MFTPSKPSGADFTDVTILNTPQPQATSTVQRKSTLESKVFDKDVDETVSKQLMIDKNDTAQRYNESSLGILKNMSSFLSEVSGIEEVKVTQDESKLDAELELARKLLQKCSSIKSTSITSDTNKENNTNVPNVSSNVTPSTLTDSAQLISYSQINPQNENTAPSVANKTSSIIFEPYEITARSSGLNRRSEEYLSSSASSKNLNQITFDSVTAELMAMLNNEDFRSASDMASQILADEMSWQQNYSYAVPTTATAENDYLNLSCFSGITGGQDLFIEGRKVSVSEYFMRKCGHFGELSDVGIERPSLGLSVSSPPKKNQPLALVDSTCTSAVGDSSIESSVVKDKTQNIPNISKDIEEQSVMSLTSIAQALHDIDNGTPRRLVDQLIMAKKRKKLAQGQNENIIGHTYTLLFNRKSMPATSSNSTDDFERNMRLLNYSLDSKMTNESIDVKHSVPRMLSLDFNSEINFEKEEIGQKENIKVENVSYKDKSESHIQDFVNLQESYVNNVVIGKNTEELCSCIVGISREVNIELLNKSNRWVIYTLNINQIQGNKHNVRLRLPKDVILIKPNAEQCTKISVTVLKMCKPIITVLDITVSDMVTRIEWIMKHIICIKPEEVDISVSNLTQKKELDFKYIAENSTAVLPVKIKNKNSVDVPIKLSILKNELAIFSLENQEELQHVILKSQELCAVSVQCKGIMKKDTDTQQHLQRHAGTLIIQAGNTSEDNVIVQEIPLIVQVGIYKIQTIDTDLPLVVPHKQSKPLSVINLGTIPTQISASFVQEIEVTDISKHFSVEPENLLVQPNEIGCFFVTYKQQISDNPKMHARIKLTTVENAHYYSIIGESSLHTEAENENIARCDTPQYLQSSSPSSPHSVVSNKSGVSGRNSPLSLVSTIAGDKIPIRTTHAALIWNSVKTGKSEIKEFIIRNTSNNKIKIQAVILDSEQNFRFLRERQAVGTTMVLVLQGSESRTLSVVFSPHHIGTATGKIMFRHYEPKREGAVSGPSKMLFLCGYGGYSKVEISEAFKDPSGKMWLSLGILNSGSSLNAKIKLQNIGDLCSYVKIKLIPKAVYPAMASSWQVNPTELLLNPKEVQWVTLEFHPRKEDLMLLQRSNVSHAGTLIITHGDEPTRWRIRRLYNKIKETGELSGSENETFRNIVHPLCKVFSGEQLISDINAIRDSVQNLGDLCRGIRQHEIMLTVEMCADETLSVLHDNVDESQMFHSLYSDNSHMCEGNSESFMPSETFLGNSTLQNDLNTDSFMVSPSVIVLNPPIRMEAIVTIRSSSIVAEPFETTLSNTDYLKVVPAEGMIPTRRDFQLKIQCKRKIERNFSAVLEILTENRKYNVQIKVIVK
ncbi:hypothetical protein K0M31_006152 [Melipona bicolor]|uniref:Centrosomal protein of 192 kDa n=1 Tax=Melipona bicolor TaxID=60889 RepID=A0AA40FTI8_9HYME|nr:hypothetical protein K0M31_006152 [Melipona bicolor]